MSHTLAYIDMRIACCKEDGHDHIGFRLEDFENIRAHIATLEAEVARKDGALQELLDATDEPPEANCSCHTSPPCSDCIDFGHIREAIATARAALKPAKEG